MYDRCWWSENSKSWNNGILNFCFENEEKRRKKWGDKFDIYENKIRTAVNSVLYEYLEYNGKPALTLFFSSCYKKTNSCKSVFGTDYPYLQSVETSGEEGYTQYSSENIVSKKETYEKKI